MSKTTTSIIVLIACAILSINAIRTITESYNVGSIYVERKKQTRLQYIEVVKKKNELDYINSPFFVEKQLRESLNYYRQGEKLLIFTRPITSETPKENTVLLQDSSWAIWLTFLKEGIISPASD